jgi:acetyl esterase/lipase
MKQFIFIVFVLVMLVAEEGLDLGPQAATNSINPEHAKNWVDVNYADDTMRCHMMDIYLPAQKKASYPVVILIYGSAWFSNDLKGNDMETIGKALLESGFAVVTPNHRSTLEAKYPAQIHDIKAAVRFLKANGAQYQLDTCFIGITGTSSGGHLAALAGTTGSTKEFQVNATSMDIEGEVGSFTNYSSTVSAVVDWFGPTDFQQLDLCGSTIIHNSANSPESRLIGGPIQKNYDKCALANPVTFVDKNDPPFLILHGDGDLLVPYCQSEILYQALQNAKVPSRFVLVRNAKHGRGVMKEKYYKLMVDFLVEASKRAM